MTYFQDAENPGFAGGEPLDKVFVTVSWSGSWHWQTKTKQIGKAKPQALLSLFSIPMNQTIQLVGGCGFGPSVPL